MKRESFQKKVSIHIVERIFIKEILHEFLTDSFAETERNLLLTKIINNPTRLSSTFVLAFALQILYIYV